jgi:hypothetical protein
MTSFLPHLRALLRTPVGRGVQQAAVVLGGFAALAFSGVIDCDSPQTDRSLGPTGPNAPVVAELVFSPAGPLSADVNSTITFTVTARDANGRPVANSQNGIVLEEQGPVLVNVTDAPDPDNAVVQVTVAARGPDLTMPWLLRARYENASGQLVAATIELTFTHRGAHISLSEGGPLTMAPGMSLPITARFLDANFNDVPGGDRFITVNRSVNASGNPVVEFVPDAGEPNGDAVLSGTLQARNPNDAGFPGRVFFDMDSPDVSTSVDVNVVNAPGGVVINSVNSNATMASNFTREFCAVARDQATGAARPDAEPFVGAVSSNTAVAVVQERLAGPANDGFVCFIVRGVANGTARIDFTYPNTAAGTTNLTVATAPPGNAGATEPSVVVHVGHTVSVFGRIVDGAGNPVPAGEPFLTARSSDSAVARVSNRNEGAADGTVEFFIQGVSQGAADIFIEYPGSIPTLVTVFVQP